MTPLDQDPDFEPNSVSIPNRVNRVDPPLSTEDLIADLHLNRHESPASTEYRIFEPDFFHRLPDTIVVKILCHVASLPLVLLLGRVCRRWHKLLHPDSSKPDSTESTSPLGNSGPNHRRKYPDVVQMLYRKLDLTHLPAELEDEVIEHICDLARLACFNLKSFDMPTPAIIPNTLALLPSSTTPSSHSSPPSFLRRQLKYKPPPTPLIALPQRASKIPLKAFLSSHWAVSVQWQRVLDSIARHCPNVTSLTGLVTSDSAVARIVATCPKLCHVSLFLTAECTTRSLAAFLPLPSLQTLTLRGYTHAIHPKYPHPPSEGPSSSSKPTGSSTSFLSQFPEDHTSLDDCMTSCRRGLDATVGRIKSYCPRLTLLDVDLFMPLEGAVEMAGNPGQKQRNRKQLEGNSESYVRYLAMHVRGRGLSYMTAAGPAFANLVRLRTIRQAGSPGRVR